MSARNDDVTGHTREAASTHEVGANSADSDPDAAPPPVGFRPVARRSGFLDLIGPLHVDETDPRAPVYGLRVGEQHTNSRGGVHGGVLSTLTDVALGYGTLAAHGATLALVTASLTIDFTGTANVGDWLEARTTLKRIGSRLAFASCEITSNGRTVASSSGVFSVPPAGQPEH
ncbi:PaaI family thioesterase [Pseudonocardia alni]|jgi:acyl-coenzyme A thioesterase 13|uniref:PaaI family thioesterase n=1 Tax=Pseudonocardia alni TaxID=33907 RepID=UPI0033D253AB